ncbi:hypothetical protein [Streptomyces sp. NPDC050504]|uniref:hypothetical protein n=1 Tax=Streptomyces sp. NPDC050504 TaxID=3365618 RepID=UPI0037B686E0
MSATAASEAPLIAGWVARGPAALATAFTDRVLRVLAPRDREAAAHYTRSLRSAWHTGPAPWQRTAPVAYPVPDTDAVERADWDWRPVRRALVEELGRSRQPSAWVVRPGAVPWPGAGTQRVVTVWMTTAQGGVPVDWQLVRPDRGPANALAARTSAALESALDAWTFSARPAPLVLDVRDAGLRGAVETLSVHDAGYLLRINHSTCVYPAVRTAVRGLPALATARQLTLSADHTGHRALHTVAIGSGPAAVRRDILQTGCDVPWGHSQRRHVLFAERDPDDNRRCAFWLTNLERYDASGLARLAHASFLTARSMEVAARRATGSGFASVDPDARERHLTLVSLAHAVALLHPTRPLRRRPAVVGARTAR